MSRRRLVAVLAVVCLVTAGIGAGVGVASADDVLVDLDENTPLTERSTWEAFEQEGVATADVAAPALSITVAKEHDEIDVDGFHNDYANEYVRVEYGEDIPREIRFYVPSNYWGPYYDESVESIAGDDVSAKFVPVNGGKYTAVSIRFQGKTDAVFPASQIRGKTWSFWSDQDRKVENATGVSTGIDGVDQWNYADRTDWSNGTLVVSDVAKPSRLSIQYDADESANRSVWLQVPDGESRRAPVYSFTREANSSDGNATVVVVTEAADPPPIRIKRRATARDGIGSVLNDWGVALDRAGAFVDRLLGSGDRS